MEPPKAATASSPSFTPTVNSLHSQTLNLSSPLSSTKMQVTMENMLKTITEIDQHSTGIVEDVEKCKDSALERKKIFDEAKEHFQKAAYTVLDMLDNRDTS